MNEGNPIPGSEEVNMRLKPDEVRIINGIRALRTGKVEVYKADGRLADFAIRPREQGLAPTPRPATETASFRNLKEKV